MPDRREEALADCDKAIRLNPDDAAAYFSRGFAKVALGRHEEALGDYDEAIRLNPDFAEAYFDRGAAKRALGRRKEGAADLLEAMDLNPDYFNFKYLIKYTMRGIAKSALSRLRLLFGGWRFRGR